MGRLRELVLRDPALCQRLLPLRDRVAFTSAVVEMARDAGLALSPEDVDDELAAARRRWQTRWV